MTLATKPANLALLKKKGVALADAVTTGCQNAPLLSGNVYVSEWTLDEKK
mgnify:FL=1